MFMSADTVEFPLSGSYKTFHIIVRMTFSKSKTKFSAVANFV